MPRLCAAPGCTKIVDKGRCPEHQRDPSYRNRYKRKAWRDLRLVIANRDGWICQSCKLPITVESDLHVDHILPVSSGGTDEPSNLRAMHHACHSSRTARGNRG